jgi:hypothetical protein
MTKYRWCRRVCGKSRKYGWGRGGGEGGGRERECV